MGGRGIMANVIHIARDFTAFPRGRTPADGKGNGTTFREQFLLPVLKKGACAEVILDGAYGYPVSFLEEAFGGLVEKEGYSPDEVLGTFTLVANQLGYRRLVMLIESIVREAGMGNKIGGALL